jgi:hypothetical protein
MLWPGINRKQDIRHLQLLVMNGDSVRIRGGYASLVGSIKFAAKKKKLSTTGEVLNSNSDWRPTVNGNEYW